MKITRVLSLIVLATLLPIAQASGQNTASRYVEPPDLKSLVAAAAKEGVLELAAGQTFGGAAGAAKIQDAIDKRYHINLQIHYTTTNGGVQYIAQLTQEIRAGQTPSSDIMFEADSVAVVPYIQLVDWKKYVPNLPPGETIYGGKAVKMMSIVDAFSYNTKLVPPNEVPKSFADLLNPKWKGRIATSNYEGSFLDYIGFPSVFGHQGMLDYVKKFSQQVGGLMNCSGIDRIVAGEFAIFGLDCGDHEARLRARKGEPIASFYPKEGTEINYIAPAIPTTAVHPNAARLFLVFLLSREGQDILWNATGEDNDLLPGSHMGTIIADLKKHGVKMVEGTQGTGLDASHPEVVQYTKEIGDIINQSK